MCMILSYLLTKGIGYDVIRNSVCNSTYMHWDRWALWWNRLRGGGGLGLAILTFGFGVPPDSPPITVISIILAVITCIAILQAAGGLDLFVTIAEKILQKRLVQSRFLGQQLLIFLRQYVELVMSLFPFILLLLKSQLMQE